MSTQRRRIALAVAWICVAGLIGWPIVRLAGVALEAGPGGIVATLTAPRIATAIWNSLWTAALVSVLAVVLGTAGALVTERAAVPGRRWLRAGMLISLLVPPFVGAFGWARAFGPRGLSDQLIGWQLPGLYGPVGIVAVLAVAATPLAYLIVAGALASRVEPDLERAARASGAGPTTTFRTITLPLLRPALLSAAVVTFVFAVNAFGVPAVLGTPAGFSTITTRLYQDLARSADPAAFARAATLAATLVVMAIGVVGSADALLGGRGAVRTSRSAGAGRLGAGGWAIALGMGAAIVVVKVVPLVAVALTALTRAVGLEPVPANWTLANFAEALDSRLAGGLANSLALAVAAATIVLILGGLVVAAGGGSRGGGSRGGAGGGRRSLVGTLTTPGFAVPGSALAVAVLLAWGGWLRDTLALILLAYLAKFWAIGYRQLAASVDRLPPDLVRAARASGAGAIDALRTVTIPALRPSIVAGWLVVFVFAVHELTMSSLLYGPGTATLAVVVLNAQQLGDPTVSAALAIILTAVTVAAAVPLALLAGRGRRARPAGGGRVSGGASARAGEELAVDCRAVDVAYGERRVITGLDLAVAPGEMVVLLGPSGSGKTTILGAIAGFLPISGGEIRVAGRVVAAPGRHEPADRRNVAVVFQDYALWPHMSALETVAYPLRRRPARGSNPEHEARSILERLGIGSVADRRPAEMSGGEQQRVGLGRALARGAAVQLFDEPTAHVDATLARAARGRDRGSAARVRCSGHLRDARHGGGARDRRPGRPHPRWPDRPGGDAAGRLRGPDRCLGGEADRARERAVGRACRLGRRPAGAGRRRHPGPAGACRRGP